MYELCFQFCLLVFQVMKFVILCVCLSEVFELSCVMFQIP